MWFVRHGEAHGRHGEAARLSVGGGGGRVGVVDALAHVDGVIVVRGPVETREQPRVEVVGAAVQGKVLGDVFAGVVAGVDTTVRVARRHGVEAASAAPGDGCVGDLEVGAELVAPLAVEGKAGLKITRQRRRE